MLPVLDEQQAKERIAKRIAMEFHGGDVVNLGIGIPTLVSDYIPEDTHIIYETENGAVGAGPKPEKEDLRFIGAGGRCLSMLPGSALVASDTSFGLIRGGHIDYTVLGALQIDEEGSLANWWIPGKIMPGMGGAMDLVTGVKHVIIGTLHTSKKGEPKLVKTCNLPLTGVQVADMVVTEYCVMTFPEGSMTLVELAPEISVEELRTITAADFAVSESLTEMGA
jgi:3-oxoacid CoA-transferase subunit B/acetate CoA/acetoacetate CoA-transferase beta subunit